MILLTAQYCLLFFPCQNRLHVGFQGILVVCDDEHERVIVEFLIVLYIITVIHQLTIPKVVDNRQVLENPRPFLYQYSFPKL